MHHLGLFYAFMGSMIGLHKESRFVRVLVCIWLVALAQFGFAWGDKPYNAAYDPFRDPFIDFESAKHDAAKSGKLILIEFGGDLVYLVHATG